ncbi:MAG: response regulator [Betaproteobacteria bacterium]|nr:response regulator [Betaproteobacteria bacterium]
MFTILIVEDNLRFSESLRKLLQERFPSSRLAKARNVQEALAAIDSLHPKVIFLDVRLPDGNGLDLVERLRAERIDAAIAVMTSHDLPEYREQALSRGADRFLVKGSASLSDIFSVVESAIASRGGD